MARRDGSEPGRDGRVSLVPEKAWHIAREYGSLDYKDAVVLDVGADYGCTAEFFLARGAKHVFASEANPEWRRRLAMWAAGKPVTVVSATDKESAEDLLGLAPDIVKMDCEGCEATLLGVGDSFLSIPRAWILETHTAPLYEALTDRFRALGFLVTDIEYHEGPNKQGQVCRIWKAERA